MAVAGAMIETMTNTTISLNAQQEEAASHLDGPCFVCACPGSGKTRVIVERTVRMVGQGISPRSILSLTFTNKAADEMKERISKILGKEQSSSLYMSTFHALAANVLRRLGSSIGYGSNMSIYDSDDQESFMAQIARQMGFELDAPQISEIVWKFNDLRENLKPEDEILGEFVEDWKGKIAMQYLAKLRAKGAIDFTGLLYEFVRLLEEDKTVLEKMRSRFKYLQVDEAQDTNYAQFRIVQLLGENGNVFIVGDPDQSIYAWRGARYENIQDFISSKNARVISLPLNYRSTPEIVAAAAALIKKNPDRQQETEFITVNESGDPVRCFSLPTPELEGKWLGYRIKELIESGIKPEEIAVLYRLNSMSRSIETGLVQSQVPYQMIGGFGFYDRKEVKDALAMLRFLINPFDGIALGRFINKPKRAIGQGMLGKIEQFAENNKINLIEALKRASEYMAQPTLIKACLEVAAPFEKDYTGKNIGEIMNEMVEAMRYDEYLKTDKDAGDKYEDRKDNQQELINSAAQYSEQRSSDIAAYLNMIALSTSTDKKTETGRVSLMTIHASKGLEFPVVFLPRLEEGMMPHKRAVQERKNGLEEERRLCYVGMTRAQRILVCTFTKKTMSKYSRGGVQYIHNQPSRFLKESGVLESVKELQPAN